MAIFSYMEDNRASMETNNFGTPDNKKVITQLREPSNELSARPRISRQGSIMPHMNFDSLCSFDVTHRSKHRLLVFMFFATLRTASLESQFLLF